MQDPSFMMSALTKLADSNDKAVKVRACVGAGRAARIDGRTTTRVLGALVGSAS
jgi:hypothetical protein